MKLPHRKSKLQRTLNTIGNSLDVSSSVDRGLSNLSSGKDLRKSVSESGRPIALITAGLVGLTAGSAGISSYRRRKEGTGHDS